MIVLVLVAVSCTKDKFAENASDKVRIDVDGSICDLVESKSSANAIIRLTWTNNDKVYAYDNTKYLGELTVSTETGKTAKLSGTISVPADSKITLVHSPLLKSEADAQTAFSNGNVRVDMSEQNEDKTPYVVYGILDYSGQTNITDQLVDFSFAMSFMKVNCTGLPTGDVASASVINVNAVCCIAPQADAEPTISGDVIGTVTRTGGITSAAGDSRALFQVALPADAHTGRGVAVVKGGTKYSSAFTSAEIGYNKSLNSVYDLHENIIGPFSVATSHPEEDPNAKHIKFSPGNLYCIRNGSEGSYTYSFAFEKNQWDYRGLCIDGFPYKLGEYSKYELVAPADYPTTFPGMIYEANTSGLFQRLSVTYTDEEGRKSFGAFSTLSQEQINQTTQDANSNFGGVFGDGQNWRTLNVNEWYYLVSVRRINGETDYGHTFVKATINSVTGTIIFPDNYSGPTENLTYIPYGCLFLPFAGKRDENAYYLFRSPITFKNSWYWANDAVMCYSFYTTIYTTYYPNIGRNEGLSVRLVADI